MKKICIIFFSVSVVFMFSCKTSRFEGLSQEADAIEAVEVTCKQNELDTSETKSISNRSNTKLSVTGKICLNGKITKVKGEANILFIVDTSNSMANADHTGIFGNCDRKRAIEKVKNLTTGGSSSSNVQGAIVTFGAYATASDWTNLSSLSTSKVCEASGGTNYEDAFEKAKSLLSGKDGTNIIYFITDGAPSVSNSTDKNTNHWDEADSAGRTAMNNLKSSVSNLTVNAIYLVDPNLSSYSDGAPTKSQTYNYLVSIVGSSSRVKEASSASELVTQITSFDTTPAGTFSSKEKLTATFTANSSSRNIEVKSLNWVSDGVYEYELEEVTLKGERNKTIDNIFKVVGTGSNGTTSTSTVTVKFSQTN